MRAVEAVIKVSPDGSAVLNTKKLLTPGLHKIMIITDESTVREDVQRRKRKEKPSRLEVDSFARMAEEFDISQRGNI